MAVVKLELLVDSKNLGEVEKLTDSLDEAGVKVKDFGDESEKSGQKSTKATKSISDEFVKLVAGDSSWYSTEAEGLNSTS